MERIQKQKPTQKTETVVEERDEAKIKAAREVGEAVLNSIDGVLDEIDDLIETGEFINAEEYVQKGGQ